MRQRLPKKLGPVEAPGPGLGKIPNHSKRESDAADASNQEGPLLLQMTMSVRPGSRLGHGRVYSDDLSPANSSSYWHPLTPTKFGNLVLKPRLKREGPKISMSNSSNLGTGFMNSQLDAPGGGRAKRIASSRRRLILAVPLGKNFVG